MVLDLRYIMAAVGARAEKAEEFSPVEGVDLADDRFRACVPALVLDAPVLALVLAEAQRAVIENYHSFVCCAENVRRGIAVKYGME